MKSRAADCQAAWPSYSAESHRPCNPFRRVALAKISSQWPYIIKKTSCQVFFVLKKPYLKLVISFMLNSEIQIPTESLKIILFLVLDHLRVPTDDPPEKRYNLCPFLHFRVHLSDIGVLFEYHSMPPEDCQS